MLIIKEGDTALLLVGNAGNESTLRVVKTLNGKDADANRIQHSELPATNKGHERK
jgi:hypothetical protein